MQIKNVAIEKAHHALNVVILFEHSCLSVSLELRQNGSDLRQDSYELFERRGEGTGKLNS